jgi:hypothetical protein
LNIRESGRLLNNCFPDPPGYRETIEQMRSEKKKPENEGEPSQPTKPTKGKSNKSGSSIPRPPEGISRFEKSSLVDLWWGPAYGWRGPYVVKSGLRYGNTLVKVFNPKTGSQAFVSEKNLRKNQIKDFK